MDFGFDVSYLFQCDKEGIAIVDGNQFKNMNKKILYSFNTVLDSIGEASAKVRVYFKKAQSLKAVITNGIRFIGSDHIIYIKCEESAVIGFLKVGKKKLFIVDEIAKIREINPMCVLDFYVHESQQRNGYGKMLFDKMLVNERLEAKNLAYDRPSEKLINFLDKYFGLNDYIPQNNNFVVFKDYFTSTDKNGFPLSENNEKIFTKYPGLNDYTTPPKKYKSIKCSDFKYENTNNSDNKIYTNYDINSINIKSEEKKNQNQSALKTPWALNDNSSYFASSSSTYGAYYSLKYNK